MTKPSIRQISLVVMGAFYVMAGVRHFTHTDFYLQIMPPFVPAHLAMVYLSGVAEVALGAGLLVPKSSRLAAWGIIALLIAVFPANIYMWAADVHLDGQSIPWWFHAIRLPLQGVLIAWAGWHARASADGGQPRDARAH